MSERATNVWEMDERKRRVFDVLWTHQPNLGCSFVGTSALADKVLAALDAPNAPTHQREAAGHE